MPNVSLSPMREWYTLVVVVPTVTVAVSPSVAPTARCGVCFWRVRRQKCASACNMTSRPSVRRHYQLVGFCMEPSRLSTRYLTTSINFRVVLLTRSQRAMNRANIPLRFHPPAKAESAARLRRLTHYAISHSAASPSWPSRS